MNRWNPTANRNTLWAATFVAELQRGGLECAVVAPGSRSTPLTLALAHRPGIQTYLLLDERSAGFFALGLAKASGRPVALVCTSGSAAANFHPAVVEADLSEVPLLVLTADRPPVLRDTGAGQTIDQLKLYGGAVRWFHELGEPVLREADLRRLRGLAARALFEASRAPAGPVHLNFPFRKPLEAQSVPEDLPPELAALAAQAMQAEAAGPYSRGVPSRAAAAPETLARLAGQVRAAPRGLILCGPMIHAPRGLANGSANGKAPEAAANGRPPEAEWPAALAVLARRTGYPILAEPPAGVVCGSHDTSRVIAHAEAILRTPAFRGKLAPQLVLRFGGMPTAKHVEVLLDEHPDCPVALVNEGGRWLEPTHHPTELICAEPARFCSDLAEALGEHRPGSEWLAAFWEADRLAAQAVEEAFAAPPPQGLGEEWFEGRVFRELAALLPEGAVQFTASSMPVRDLAAFTPVTARAVRHLVNRGANGIDGTLSSALGAAAAAQRSGAGPAVLVTGDLAFHHDANGLQAARQHGLPLTVVLINNDGGGIFEMLPIAEYGEAYETYFGTPHGIDFAALCAAYGIAHSRPRDWADFRAQVRASLQAAQQGGGTRVIEVRTERRHNRVQHERVWQTVAARLAQAFPPPRRIAP
jgi:2-succinyl-5-enolpyruvyl-6-hydroxy-3-cyclohexene-1-carboxylate synthase